MQEPEGGKWWLFTVLSPTAMPLLTELDEPVGDVGGIRPEVFRVEAFATAPVTDGSCD